MIWYYMIWSDTLWYNMIWYDWTRYDMIWYGIRYYMIWYDTLWYDMAWHDVIFFLMLFLLRLCFDLDSFLFNHNWMLAKMLVAMIMKWTIWFQVLRSAIIWLDRKCFPMIWYFIWYLIWYDILYDMIFYTIWY